MERCEFCEWHDDFSWVCTNGLSEYCGEFTNNEYSCPDFERIEYPGGVCGK